jgi:hypothetical protein
MEAGSGVDSAAKRSLLADSDHDPGNGVTKNLLLNNWVEQVQVSIGAQSGPRIGIQEGPHLSTL